jgi:ketosteroid isomerase-like protein
MTTDPTAEITRLEHERGVALVNADWPALDALMADDLVHIHTTGLIDDKAQYLEGARTKLDYLKVERVSLQVRSCGEIAIATGVLNQTLRIKGPETVVEIRAATTQVWIRRNGRWLQNSFQATRIG